MSLLDAVRDLIKNAPERASTEAHLDTIETKLGDIKAERESTQAAHAQVLAELASAEESFEREPTDKHADAVLVARQQVNRSALYVARMEHKWNVATGELKKQRRKLLEVELAEVENRIQGYIYDRADALAPIAKIVELAAQLRSATKELGERQIRDVTRRHELLAQLGFNSARTNGTIARASVDSQLGIGALRLELQQQVNNNISARWLL